MPNCSHIKHGPDGTSFVGPDAIALFRAATIASALAMYAKYGMQPNRAYTPALMLKAATGITGKAYRCGQYQQAADDIRLWCATMKAALPVVEG